MIQKVIVKGFRILRDINVPLRPGRNVLVGNNDAGKSTFLQAIHLALTGQFGGRSLATQLSPDLFNTETVIAFCDAVNSSKKVAAPEILIEVFFNESDEVAKFRGTNNSLKEDAYGVSFAIRLNDDFADDYAAHIKVGKIQAVPVEFYSADWRSFAGSTLFSKKMPARSRLIDATYASGERDASKYLLDVVETCLNASQRATLSLSYREMKAGFLALSKVIDINEELKARSPAVSEHRLSLSLDTSTSGTWEKSVVTRLDDVPFSLVGRGEQVSLKVRLALAAASAADVLLLEEPENHLSHSNMSALVDRLSQDCADRQIIITTHSSFVVNKLGLGDILLFSPGQQTPLTALKPETQTYFRKLPGHDSLRLILSKRAILVEGASDELVVQRAYLDLHKKLPLTDGVEVITIRGLAFKRFLEVAALVGASVTVVTDNDGDPTAAAKRIEGFETTTKLCMSPDASLTSLEFHLAAVNDLPTLDSVLGTKRPSKEAHRLWMSQPENKTEAAIRFFDSTVSVSWPAYVNDAVA